MTTSKKFFVAILLLVTVILSVSCDPFSGETVEAKTGIKNNTGTEIDTVRAVSDTNDQALYIKDILEECTHVKGLEHKSVEKKPLEGERCYIYFIFCGVEYVTTSSYPTGVTIEITSNKSIMKVPEGISSFNGIQEYIKSNQNKDTTLYIKDIIQQKILDCTVK
jgi:hypothetical protein